MSIEIRPIREGDRPSVRQVVSEAFASPRIVSRGVLHAADDLPGFLAEEAGQPVGVLLYHMGACECEVVALVSLQERKGVATTLLAEAERVARAARCRRLWLATTNDNLSAIAFYRKQGWRQIAIRRGAVAEARRLKPEIPKLGTNGLPKEDEIEFELALGVVLVIERVHDQPSELVGDLLSESEQAGSRIVRRLVEEWASGVNRFDRPGEALFGARAGGRLVGVCGLNVDPYARDERVGRVRHLYVLSACRRLGVGRQLVTHVMEAARGRFDHLRLRTHDPAAARLYESLGFCPRDWPGDSTHAVELASVAPNPE